MTHTTKMPSVIWVLLSLVLVLTAGLRWFRFTTFPPGLWYDEAYHLVEGQRLAQGAPPQIYYPEKTGSPAIFWLTGLALRLGANHLAPRWVTSTTSMLGVLLLFLAVRDVLHQEIEHTDWVAAGSAAALGVNYAYLFNSRIGWEPTLVTTVSTVVVWLFWRGIRSGRLRDFAGAGLALGCSQYTSVAARLLPFVLLLVLIGWLGTGRQHWRKSWKGVLVTVGAAGLTFAPLAWGFLSHPEWFTRRLGVAAQASELLTNLGRTLAGLVWLGGAALHSLPGRPVYDPAMALLLLGGTAVAGWRIKRPAYNLWLAWVAGFLPGGVFSSPAPVFYRILPAIPATIVLCALGAFHLWHAFASRGLRLRALVALLLIGAFTFSAWATCRDYFVRWANWPRLPAVMDVGKWRAAEVILDSPADETILVTIPDGLEPVISYALHTRTSSPARAFDGAHCLIYPTQTNAPVHYLNILGYEHRSLARLQSLFLSGYQTTDPIFGDSAPYFVNFFIPPGKVPVPGRLPSPITYRQIALHGVHAPETTLRAGQTLTITLTWESLEPLSESYTVFAHLLDGRPEAAEAPLVTQHDSLPCDATEPTWRWQPGEYVLDEHVLTVPSDQPAGEYLLGVGLYDSATLVRLPPSGENLLTRWDEAIVGSITVITR